jgi:transposase
VAFEEAAVIRGLLSDEEWACPEPFAIERDACSGWLPRDHRVVLDRIFWIARTVVAWHDLAEHFGKWSSVYRRVRRGTPSGPFELLLEAVNDSSGSNPADTSPNSPMPKKTWMER